MKRAKLLERHDRALQKIEKHVKRITGKNLNPTFHRDYEIRVLYLLEAIEQALAEQKPEREQQPEPKQPKPKKAKK